jgi:hypothetical protein
LASYLAAILERMKTTAWKKSANCGSTDGRRDIQRSASAVRHHPAFGSHKFRSYVCSVSHPAKIFMRAESVLDREAAVGAQRGKAGSRQKKRSFGNWWGRCLRLEGRFIQPCRNETHHRALLTIA